MCTRVYGAGGPNGISSPRELAEIVGGLENIIWHNGYGPHWGEIYVWLHVLPDCCLCPVNVPATLKAAGVEFEEGFMGGDWRVLSPDPALSSLSGGGE